MKTSSHQIVKNSDQSFVITLTIPKDSLLSAKTEVLNQLQSEFEAKGFRKGKAPLDIVESNTDSNKLLEEIANHVISHEYSHIIDEEKLKPIIQPQIKITNPPIDLEKDWQIEIIGSELPQIKLDPKYQEEIKVIDKNDNDRLNKIFDSLIKNSQVTIPKIVIEADLQNHLSRLVDQIQQAKMNVEDYFKSKNISPEDYQKQAEKEILKEWTLNLAIGQIAKDQKMTIEKAEVDDLLAKNPSLGQNINLVYYLIQQQKVVDYLKSL